MKKTMIVTIAAVILISSAGVLAVEKTEQKGARKLWKLDVDIYDRPGWNSFTYQFPLWGGFEHALMMKL